MHQMNNKAYKCCFLHTLNSFTVFLDEKTKKNRPFFGAPLEKRILRKEFFRVLLATNRKKQFYTFKTG